MKYRIAQLRTEPVHANRPGQPVEQGEFTQIVEVPEDHLFQSADKRQFIMAEVSKHLVFAVLDTGVPYDFWRIEFPPEVQTNIGVPPYVFLHGQAEQFRELEEKLLTILNNQMKVIQ